ncbi:hypothetical protein P3W33_14060 [Luteibacter sp. PPL552]
MPPLRRPPVIDVVIVQRQRIATVIRYDPDAGPLVRCRRRDGTAYRHADAETDAALLSAVGKHDGMIDLDVEAHLYFFGVHVVRVWWRGGSMCHGKLPSGDV